MFPEIRIGYSELLDGTYQEAFAFRAASRPGLMIYPDSDETRRRSMAYEAAWKKHEPDLLGGMCKFLGLTFSQAVIDVHIVGGGVGAISMPTVVGAREEPDRFVDILAHELLHRLLSEPVEEGKIWAIVEDKFDTEWVLTKNHILVNCTMAYLYEEVFKDHGRLVRDVEASERMPAAYKKSWEIVLEAGYNELIKDFQDDPRWPSKKEKEARGAGVSRDRQEQVKLLRCSLFAAAAGGNWQ